MKHVELTDKQRQLGSPPLSRKAAHTGRPPKNPRVMLNGIYWILKSDAPRRDLTERFGLWQSVHRYVSEWRRSGAYARIVEVLRIKLDDRGLIDWEL